MRRELPERHPTFTGRSHVSSLRLPVENLPFVFYRDDAIPVNVIATTPSSGRSSLGPDRELITCVMVTRNRPTLARRAIECFVQQTWTNRELLILDDGDESYDEIVAGAVERGARVHYMRLRPDETLKLGGLRNMALQHAAGTVIAQWDDDEWCHPDRLATQYDALAHHHAHAIVLRSTLVHVAHGPLATQLFRSSNTLMTPGTIMHRRTGARYPNSARSEDAAFIIALRLHGSVRILGTPSAHLFVRCFHGTNTWDLDHFLRRARRLPFAGGAGALIEGNSNARLRSFRLTESEQATARQYFEMSYALGVLPCL